MAGRIPDETLQEIRDRISLVEVVSHYVSLRKTGRNHLGLCPFHNEKTPSFNVSEERGFFHCFGCGVSGTVFNFVMRMDHLEFPEAVEQLAKRAGVALPRRERDDAVAEARNGLYELNARVARFFADCLRANVGAEARGYLERRGLSRETIERYGLGWAPATGSALQNWLAQQKLSQQQALQLGLLGRRDAGGFYDRFRGRVIFPIRDRRDRVIAFGGRTLGDDQPKYLNSPESALFRKGDGLYGLAEARESVRESGRVVLVEGYMDVLLLVQHGVPYTAAVLGTALTPAQLRLLRPFGGDDLTVCFFFDGDGAGRKAALRAFGVCAEAEVWGRAVFLPQGHDPDSFVRERGAQAVLDLLDSALPLTQFYYDTVAPAGAGIGERARAAEEVAAILARVKSDVRFELMAREAAQRLGVGEDVLRRARRAAPRAADPARVANVRTASWRPAEIALLELMATDREAAMRVDDRGAAGEFADDELREAAQAILDGWDAGSVDAAIGRLSEALTGRLTAALFRADEMSAEQRLKAADDCIERIKREASKRRRMQEVERMRQAERSGDSASADEILLQLNEIRRRPEVRHG